MSDLDARVAALLDDADTYAATRSIEDRYELEQALRAELQKPALHEPCTQVEAARVMAHLHYQGAPDVTMKSVRIAVDSVLQGRAKPATEGEPKTFVKRVGDGFKRQSDGTWAKPAQEEITDADLLKLAKRYGGLDANDARGIILWERNGSDLLGFARAVIRASKGEKT